MFSIGLFEMMLTGEIRYEFCVLICPQKLLVPDHCIFAKLEISLPLRFTHMLVIPVFLSCPYETKTSWATVPSPILQTIRNY